MTVPGDSSTTQKVSSVSDAAEPTPMTFGKMLGVKSEEITQPGEGDGEAEEAEVEDSEDKAEESTDEGDDDSAGDPDAAESSDEGDGDAGEEGEEAPEEGDEEVQDEPEDEALKEVAKEAKGKTLALKHKGKEYQVPKDAKFTFEKDGKKIDFSLGEIGNNLLTKREIDQQFSKLDTTKKALERKDKDITKLAVEHETLKDDISLIKEAAHSGDIFEIAQATLNVFSKGDSQVAQKLFEQLLDLTTKVSELTEDQLKASVANSQLSFKNKYLEREGKKRDEREAQAKRKNWLLGQIKANGIEFEEYVERYQALKEIDRIREEKGEPIRLHDKLSYEDIAKEVINFTKATRVYNQITSIIQKVDASRLNDNELISTICQLTDPTYSEKDIEDIIRGVIGKPRKVVSKPKDSSKGVSGTVAPPKKGPTTKEATPKKAPVGKEIKKDEDGDEEPLTFDKLKKRYS